MIIDHGFLDQTFLGVYGCTSTPLPWGKTRKSTSPGKKSIFHFFYIPWSERCKNFSKIFKIFQFLNI
jgi:hypothetical protein